MSTTTETNTPTTTSEFDSIDDAIEAFRKGEFLVVVDNEDRENEGDLIIAGEDMTAAKAAFMIRYTSGLICVTVAQERLDSLQLPLMVAANTESMRTAYTISVDYKHGTTTGISAADRSATVRALADYSKTAEDFNRPGHVFPLRPVKGGSLKRVGHTEAALDFAKLAGKAPVAAICEVVMDDGRMARRDDLKVFAKQWGLRMVTINDLVKHRLAHNLVADW
ncbi:3,4-dihydroxy-2-butanone-4-phosphate synthase [Powellomyces hirtus]|uniref:3,4-dihydroxy-2-butanone 4-phosphate synthase n=1 Tax=Powellomyces hirtus TaxID=109895 RepID=A0A507E0V7_9FUNG|nr:3,4-dihydroxy-2-butanone-4-phosphate synthase [Powellomyces hirtus]